MQTCKNVKERIKLNITFAYLSEKRYVSQEMLSHFTKNT